MPAAATGRSEQEARAQLASANPAGRLIQPEEVAAAVAFLPSFSFILLGGGRFERLRANPLARGFLAGAGPAAIGAILGSAVPLAGALTCTWQYFVLAAAAVALLLLRRGVVAVLLAAGAVGVVLALAGAPLP